MKAIVHETYGSPAVLQLKELEKPTPKNDEVLVKVYAASLNAYDWHMVTADVFLVRLDAGILRPKNTMLGADIAGRIEAVGADIKKFKVGDEVFGEGRRASGGFAEYVCARETTLILKPANLSFDEAAAVPMAAVTALQGLRDNGHIRPGQKVVIDGAGGGVGTFAVQIAKSFGAEVTAVCSAENLETARAIGADHVIDYAQEDFTRNGQHYDLILAANGYHSIFDYKRALTADGIFVVAGGSIARIFEIILLGKWLSNRGSQKFVNFLAKITPQDLGVLKELLEKRKVKPVIDRRYPLSEAAEALRYLGKRHSRGKVIITVAPDVK
jgi:NADPH:quinone reductase-like Zn-dependent oxidoreductase